MKTNKNILKSNGMVSNIIDVPLNKIQEPAWAQEGRELCVTPQSLEEMIQSIKKAGLLHPIGIKPLENGKYEIVYGERVYLACQEAGLKSIKAVVVSDEGDAALTFLIENTQRGSPLPIEEACMYQKVLDASKISQSELAEKIGISQEHIAHRLRLLKFPKPIAFLLYSGILTEEAMGQLFRVEDIIENLVTTDFTKSEIYKTEGDRFKNWAEWEQNDFAGYYAWEAYGFIKRLEEAVDGFYCNLLQASSDKYTDELERELSSQAEIIKKKDEGERTTEENHIMRELWLCECKRKYNPVLKRDEDKKFFAEQIKED